MCLGSVDLFIDVTMNLFGIFNYECLSNSQFLSSVGVGGRFYSTLNFQWLVQKGRANEVNY